MSAESVKAFFARVEEDKELQKQLNALERPADGNMAAQLAELVKVASASGFEFTPEEYWQFESGVDSATGEISEAALDQVAGGACVYPVIGRGGPFNNCRAALILHVY